MRLEPKLSQETLLFIKAHTLGLETALSAIHTIGLENAETLCRESLLDMWQNLDVYAGEVDEDAAVEAQIL